MKDQVYQTNEHVFRLTEKVDFLTVINNSLVRSVTALTKENETLKFEIEKLMKIVGK